MTHQRQSNEDYNYLPQGQEEGPILSLGQMICFAVLTVLVAALFWTISHMNDTQNAVDRLWWDASDAILGEPHLRELED